ncbi:MAG: shikimate kinase [Bacteroidales bacterium]|jgi:shikimate kinase|nr:shikimate kinase [Bacteroidales bacterium]NMD02294.1 shikimate kinase [Bacteroidales bacterium]OQB56274.1 MAG: Shikimate kinase [Bacteroidetes bacterium ADurb.Bin145]HOU01790.1 shikimate kinase [Bacteroidales bacterium]HQK68197.1 shikimate kinase [Bacteroidales bacterium]
MPGNKIVYIIGFMGSGKSTAGRKLASSLGWQFIDLDKKIEESAGKHIPDIFEQDGESRFREIESEVLKLTGSLTETIISTGGGTPCHGDNMDYMLSAGLTIYLKMTPEQLTKRLLDSSGERPLIKNVPDDKLQTFIENMLSAREKWYGRANLIVDGVSIDYTLLNNLVTGKFNH